MVAVDCGPSVYLIRSLSGTWSKVDWTSGKLMMQLQDANVCVETWTVVLQLGNNVDK